MKKLASTVAGLACAGGMVVGSGAALADGVDRAPKRAAPPPVAAAPFYPWGGLYVGAHIGGAWGDVDWRALRSPLSDTDEQDETDEISVPDGTRVSHNVDGFIGGGHIGIQHQWGRWVLGVEASLSGGDDLKDKSTRVVESEDGDDTQRDVAHLRTEMDWLILATVRVGYTWDRWMAYLKGGYAQAKFKVAGLREEFEDDEIDKRDEFRSSERHHGWTIGAGVEYLLTPNVVLGLEYNYIDLDAKRHDGAAHAIESPGDDDEERELRRFTTKVDPDAIHTVWARLSFKLNREVPVEPLK